MDNDHIIHTLNGLLAHCRESERTLRRWGAKSSPSALPGLPALCERIAAQRAAAAADLQRMVIQSGGAADTDGAAPSSGPATTPAPRRSGSGGWLGALQVCEQIEKATFDLYNDALDEPLPALVRLQLQRQQRAVEDNHRLLRRLHDQALRDCRV